MLLTKVFYMASDWLTTVVPAYQKSGLKSNFANWYGLKTWTFLRRQASRFSRSRSIFYQTSRLCSESEGAINSCTRLLWKPIQCNYSRYTVSQKKDTSVNMTPYLRHAIAYSNQSAICLSRTSKSDIQFNMWCATCPWTKIVFNAQILCMATPSTLSTVIDSY